MRAHMNMGPTWTPSAAESTCNRSASVIGTDLLPFNFILQIFCDYLQLQMFEDSFDDQYIGCTDRMETLAPGLLMKEREQIPEFDAIWTKASTVWQETKPSLGRLPDGFKDEYGIALVAVQTKFSEDSFLPYLNYYVMKFDQNPKSFILHSLHFYLTRAMTLLRPGCDGKPKSTYLTYNPFVPPSDPQALLRMGIFVSASEKSQEMEFMDKTQIITCFGVELQKFSQDRKSNVLIPVNEVFQATHYDENKINLQSTNKKCSYFNCAYLGGAKNKNCTYYPSSSSAPPIMKFSGAVTAPLLLTMSIAVIQHF